MSRDKVSKTPSSGVNVKTLFSGVRTGRRKNPFFRRTNKSSDRKRSCGTTAGEGIFSLNKAAPVVGAGILTSDLHLLSACVLGAKDSRGSKLPQALAEDLFRERELLRHFGGRKEFFRFIRRHWKLEREL